MSLGAGVEGDQELVDRISRAQAGILDLTGANREAVATVMRDVRTPHRTGALDRANTVHASRDGWGITNAQPYAPPVHWGTHVMRARPWLLVAARATEDSWMDGLTQHVQQLLD